MDSSMRLSIMKNRMLYLAEKKRKLAIQPIPKNSSQSISNIPAKAGALLFPANDPIRIKYPELFN
jgi:hypothetical protein